jgi:hypothetical protein
MKNQNNHIELPDILSNGLDDYIDEYGSLSFRNIKVINHLLQCKTSDLGGHVFSCDNCNHQFISYNSCRDRHCPKCQSLARASWVQDRMDELLPVHHFHVVFTVPHQLNPIALKNKKHFYDLLFKCVSETLRDLGKDKRWLGGMIGAIAVLHTWGQNLMEHPHIHCIIPGGGIREDGKKWVSFHDNYLFPVKVISRLFRGKFLCYLKEMVEEKQILFTGSLEGLQNEIAFKEFLNELWAKEWVVYAKEPFAHAAAVVKYLGRYTHRIAISNQRLISQGDNTVSFAWKDYADDSKQKIMELTNVEFIRRFLLHVLPERFVRIRYFGFLSNSIKTEMLKKSFELLGKKYDKKAKLKKVADIFKMILNVDITCCPKCKTGHYVMIKEIVKNLYCGTLPVRMECR